MNELLESGIPMIVWLQGLGDWLTSLMKFFSFLGTVEFYLLLFPIMIWCIDVAKGIRIGVLFFFSSGINTSLKLAFSWPRPYWVTDKVKALTTSPTFGMPSGHAQNAVILWGAFSAWIRKTPITVLFGLLIFLVSISRLYLGVHFPADTLVGSLVGVIMLVAFIRYEDRLSDWVRRQSFWKQIRLAMFASVSVLAVGILVFTFVSTPPPQEWIHQAAEAAPDTPEINPRSLKDVIAISGALLGLGIGATLLFQWGGFDAGGPWSQRAIRFAVGAVGLAILFFGLRAILPSGETFLAMSMRYLRYASAGFWGAYLGPKLFVALKLA